MRLDDQGRSRSYGDDGTPVEDLFLRTVTAGLFLLLAGCAAWGAWRLLS